MPTIGTTEWSSVDDGNLESRAKLAIQNLETLGSGKHVYMDTTPGNVAATGLRIEPGGIYELPTRPPNGVHLATASSTADVRVIRL